MTASTHARALVLETPRHLVEQSFELPEIGADDGLLRVEACGLCGTDHEQYTGQLHPGRPVRPRPRDGRDRRGGRRRRRRALGRAAGRPGGACRCSSRAASAAPAGAATTRHCKRHGHGAPCTGSRAPRSRPGLWGGYATHHYLGPDSLLLPVPDGLDPVLATAVQPARRRHPVGGHGARHDRGRPGRGARARASAGCRACAAAKEPARSS